MKKRRLNKNFNKEKRKIISFIIILVFILYFCLTLIVSNRHYLFIEKVFKSVSSSINSFFIDNAYSNYESSNNIINSKIKYLEKENSKLKSTLGLKEENVNYVAVKIVNHTTKTWFDRLDINAGYKKGIKKGYPVISSDGLIGFVSKTSKNVSEVKLLTSTNENSLLSVLIETNDGPVAGVLSDYDVKKGLFKVTDVTHQNEILAGDSVVLSGYDNETYKGIYVGRVVKEENSNYGLSRTIWVESSVNFDDLLFALVVINEWLFLL